MLVKPNGDFLSMRHYSRMALIRVSSHVCNLHLDAPGQQTLVLPKNPSVDQQRFIMTRWEKRTLSAYIIPGLHLGRIRQFRWSKGPQVELHECIYWPMFFNETEKKEVLKKCKYEGGGRLQDFNDLHLSHALNFHSKFRKKVGRLTPTPESSPYYSLSVCVIT